MRQGLHPVQKRIATMHGSQCGYCTPGIVMAIYTQLRRNPSSTPHDIEESLDGNLCRCTGYRPILDAAKSLSNVKSGCCKGNGESCACFSKSTNEANETIVENTTENALRHQHSCSEESKEMSITEPIFPPNLMKQDVRSLKFSLNGITWYQPIDLASLHYLKGKYNGAKIVVGNTEVGIETKFKSMSYPIIINAAHVPELKIIKIQNHDGQDGIIVGGSVTLTSLRAFIEELKQSRSKSELRGLIAISHMLKWFASNHIRNVACVAGNIVTASPISDLNPMLMANKAILKLSSSSTSRYVPIKDFFLAYRKVDMNPDEILEYVFIPFTSNLEFIVPLKQARRREDDISIVTSGINIKLVFSTSSNSFLIEKAVVAYGGMAPLTKIAIEVCASLQNKPWNSATFEEIFPILRKEFSLPENVPGGQAEYRMSLAISFLFKSFLIVNHELQEYLSSNDGMQYMKAITDVNILDYIPIISSRDQSGSENFITSEKTESRGQQTYSTRQGGLQKGWPITHEAVSGDESRSPVGDPLMHKSAYAQVTGEAQYTDDTPLPKDSYHAALVTSTRAHARLLKIDSSAIESMDGFIAIYTAKDITGENHIGAVIKDEEVFVTEIVKHYGAVIGVVIATTHEKAVFMASKVVISYEDLPPIISIEDAIANDSYFPGQHQLISGDVSAGEKESDVIVEGQIRIGGQEHFYLETNATVAIPKEHGHLEVISSTQNPTKTQNFCAYVTGLPASHIVSKCKRMGGGFGGKETRSVFIAVTAALAAHLSGHAVAISIERDLDMSVTGQRHAFLVNYKAGATKDGRLKFLDATLLSNGGFSLDLSQPVMDRALFHADSVYNWPAVHVRGRICRTNQPSHTAFRGFGGPQGLLVSETAVDHISRVLKIPSDVIKQNNFYREGDVTHFGMRLEGFYIPSMFERAINVSDFHARRNKIQEFNQQNRWRKRGIDILPTKFGISFTAKFMNQGGALVHVYQDGTVLVAHGGTEMGQGLHTKVIQIAAKCFGIPDTWVHIAETATNTVANSSPTAASMSTDLYGMATLNACEQLLDRLNPVRSSMPSTATWKEIVLSAFFQRIDLSAHGYYIVPTDRCGFDWDKSVEENTKTGQPFNYFTQGVAVSEVEIDCLSGDSKIIRADIFMDVGKTINPALDIGQIEGAFIQG